MPRCYFCNGECDGNLNLIVNYKILAPGELLRTDICTDCFESVKGALALLKHVTPKKGKVNEN